MISREKCHHLNKGRKGFRFENTKNFILYLMSSICIYGIFLFSYRKYFKK